LKHVKIFRHIECEGPAYLQTLLEQLKIPFKFVRVDKNESVPKDLAEIAGMIFMGGSMSVNDELAWLKDENRLIQMAIQNGIPVLGVCLGSQLIAKALGARIYPGEHQCMELGWSPVKCVTRNEWTKDLPGSFDVFHWHGETFDLPEGATRLFSNELYSNQGFAFGPHLALQFHVEMTADSVREWVGLYTEDIERRCDINQAPYAMLDNLEARILQLQKHASILFMQWLAGVVVN